MTTTALSLYLVFCKLLKTSFKKAVLEMTSNTLFLPLISINTVQKYTAIQPKPPVHPAILFTFHRQICSFKVLSHLLSQASGIFDVLQELAMYTHTCHVGVWKRCFSYFIGLTSEQRSVKSSSAKGRPNIDHAIGCEINWVFVAQEPPSHQHWGHQGHYILLRAVVIISNSEYLEVLSWLKALVSFK